MDVLPEAIATAPEGSPLILVPAGHFIMGSALFDEKPQHRHYLPAYYISVHPVTNRRYDAFVAATGYAQSSEWREFVGPGREDHPVVKVSWYDAVEYCRWAGVRLPTEPEWEKACRGEDGREYPWGEEWDPERCRNSVEDDSMEGTCAVTSYPGGESPYGVRGQAGNVWEWCANVYREDLYSTFTAGDFSLPMEGETGVLRGGGWEDVDEFFFRCSTRLANPRTLRHRQAGFRIAMDVVSR